MAYANKRILGIIPARGGSKGIPGKNTISLGGKPLINWVWEASRESKLIDEIVLSSEDDSIIQVAKSLGIPVPFKRPSNLALDNTLVVDVIIHAIDWFKNNYKTEFDYICLIQPTAPFAQTEDYEKAIIKAVENNADTVITVYQCDSQHPSMMYTMDSEGRTKWFLEEIDNRMARRQDMTPVYLRSGLVYVFNAKMLVERRTLYGENLYAIEVPKDRGMVDINSPFDLKLARLLIEDSYE